MGVTQVMNLLLLVTAKKHEDAYSQIQIKSDSARDIYKINFLFWMVSLNNVKTILFCGLRRIFWNFYPVGTIFTKNVSRKGDFLEKFLKMIHLWLSIPSMNMIYSILIWWRTFGERKKLLQHSCCVAGGQPSLKIFGYEETTSHLCCSNEWDASGNSCWLSQFLFCLFRTHKLLQHGVIRPLSLFQDWIWCFTYFAHRVECKSLLARI